MLNHRAGATRGKATLLLEEVEAALDSSVDAEDLKGQTRTMRRTFELDEEPTEPIKNFRAFRDALETLIYRGQRSTGKLADPQFERGRDIGFATGSFTASTVRGRGYGSGP